METLKIKNFLCIKEAEIEIKKINLFIGPQAQGKSVIAKLIYFFKEYPQAIFDAVFREMDKNKSDFDNAMLVKFEKIFPKYTWEKSIFSIEYSNKYYSISIFNEKLHENNFSLHLSNSNRIDKTFLETKNNYNDFFIKRNETKREYFNSELFKIMQNTIEDNLFSENEHRYREQVSYIPAGRSFFANLQKNIFSLVDSDIQLEFFLKKFGKDYEFIKNNDFIFYESNIKIDNLIEKLIGGQFKSEKGQDWIVNSKGKISVINCSSGQQESLPIAIILSKHHTSEENHTSAHFVIEEPEAHLFPTAQSAVISLIALVYNDITRRGDWNYDPEIEDVFLDNIVLQRQNTFTITTHSPYILTAFNNLIQAGNVAASKNYQNLEELYKVVPKDEIVDFNDVSAYLVNNGTVQSILDNELKLIDATMIDSVSRQFANTFEQLVIMEDEHD